MVKERINFGPKLSVITYNTLSEYTIKSKWK